MAVPKGDKDGLYTYTDYLGWPENERWELIDGVAYNMSPSPARRHQGVLAEVAAEFVTHFRSRPCSVYQAPFDVLLPEQVDNPQESATVVQPDLLVVCNSAQLTERGCTGAPDFVLEILSPSTASKDMSDKLHLYERHGVREYWILNPANDTLIVYSVEAPGTGAGPPKYGKPVLHTADEIVAPRIFPELMVNLSRAFDRDRD